LFAFGIFSSQYDTMHLSTCSVAIHFLFGYVITGDPK